MELARSLHMTRQQLLQNTTSEELTLWMALWRIEGDERHKRDLAAKAQAALKGR